MSLIETAKRLFTGATPAETAATIAAKLPDLRARLEEARHELAALETSTTAANAIAVLEGSPVKTPRDLDQARATVSALAAAIGALESQHIQASKDANLADRRRVAEELIAARKVVGSRVATAAGTAVAALRQLSRCGVGPLEFISFLHAQPMPEADDFSPLKTLRDQLYALGATEAEVMALVPGTWANEAPHRFPPSSITAAIEKEADRAEKSLAKAAGLDLDAIKAAATERAAAIATQQADRDAAEKLSLTQWIEAVETLALAASHEAIPDRERYEVVYTAALELTSISRPLPPGLTGRLSAFESHCLTTGKPVRSVRNRPALAAALQRPMQPL